LEQSRESAGVIAFSHCVFVLLATALELGCQNKNIIVAYHVMLGPSLVFGGNGSNEREIQRWLGYDGWNGIYGFLLDIRVVRIATSTMHGDGFLWLTLWRRCQVTG